MEMSKDVVSGVVEPQLDPGRNVGTKLYHSFCLHWSKGTGLLSLSFPAFIRDWPPAILEVCVCAHARTGGLGGSFCCFHRVLPVWAITARLGDGCTKSGEAFQRTQAGYRSMCPAIPSRLESARRMKFLWLRPAHIVLPWSSLLEREYHRSV